MEMTLIINKEESASNPVQDECSEDQLSHCADAAWSLANLANLADC